MKPRRFQLEVAIFFLAGIAACIGLVFFIATRVPAGGIRSDYDATDFDPTLTVHARTALPIIDAINTYHTDNGSYPAGPEDLQPLIAGDWSYWQLSDEPGYTLSLKLGWDASLDYTQTGDNESWAFHPGDGSPEKQIKLNIVE